MAPARSSSGGVAIRYTCTSGFVDDSCIHVMVLACVFVCGDNAASIHCRGRDFNKILFIVKDRK